MLAGKKWMLLTSAIVSAVPFAPASAAINIDGGPTYTSSNGGYRGSTSSIAVNPGHSDASAGGNGLTIASETYYAGATNSTATISNGIVINPLAANGYTVLSQVPSSTSGYTAIAIDPSASLIAGTAQVSSASTGATVWTPDGTPYTLPLPTFTGSTAAPNATARAINDAGTVVGAGAFFNANGLQASSSGYAYYNSGTSAAPSYSGGSAVQLLPLGTLNANATSNYSLTVNAITASGVAVGTSSVSATNNYSATYWTVGNAATGVTSIAANQLSVPVPSGYSATNLSGGSASSTVTTVSPGGVAGGTANFYLAGTSTSSVQPVRWTSLSTSTPSQVLSLPSASYASGNVFSVNDRGDAVGNATNTGASQTSAVLWKAGTTTPTTLTGITSSTAVANPGNAIPASPSFAAYGVNNAGYSVGYATASSNSTTPLDAVLWDSNGNVTELNSLVSLTPQTGTSAQTVAGTNYASLPTYGSVGWVSLVSALSITDNGWISGIGVYYDPNINYTTTGNPAPMNVYGNGTYYRPFEIQDAVAATPEPTSLALLSLGAVGLLSRRRPGTARPWRA